MVHQYKLNGYNIVLDVCSGGVHVVDDVAYDIISLFEQNPREAVLAAMEAKYPDLPAACFGQLMGELLVYEEDLWSPTLRQMGISLGRFIYLLDAAVDFRKDKKKGKYNPFPEEDLLLWEQHLVLDMARCTQYFEALPLVQDKQLLNCILYSGVWMEFERLRPRKKDAQEEHK